MVIFLHFSFSGKRATRWEIWSNYSGYCHLQLMPCLVESHLRGVKNAISAFYLSLWKHPGGLSWQKNCLWSSIMELFALLHLWLAQMYASLFNFFFLNWFVSKSVKEAISKLEEKTRRHSENWLNWEKLEGATMMLFTYFLDFNPVIFYLKN